MAGARRAGAACLLTSCSPFTRRFQQEATRQLDMLISSLVACRLTLFLVATVSSGIAHLSSGLAS
jgi:hypothetical protein